MTERRARPPVWIATVGGTGYFPIAPGTAGSAVGLAVVAAVGHIPWHRSTMSAALATIVVALFAVGVWAAGCAEESLGSKDPGPVVIDEVVGQVMTFLARPDARWKWLIVGFFLFRLFDVIKPAPARQAERLPGGWGIMLDDVVAGGYSLVFLSLLGFVFK